MRELGVAEDSQSHLMTWEWNMLGPLAPGQSVWAQRVVQPSEADRRTHEQLTEAAKILGLRIIDHIIVTRKGHFSFQEAGLIR